MDYYKFGGWCVMVFSYNGKHVIITRYIGILLERLYWDEKE